MDAAIPTLNSRDPLFNQVAMASELGAIALKR
jgi:hypothetical protein